MNIKKVGIVGSGTMGVGIGQVAAQAGLETVIVKATPGSVDKPRSGLEKNLARTVEQGKMTAEVKDQIMNLIQLTPEEADLEGCDVVIESIIEDLPLKKELFQRAEEIVGPETILCTNTSTLPVTAMMAVCKTRGRVAGLHFFNPAPQMVLVEVIHAFETAEETVRSLDAFCRYLGKDPVIVQDTSGFIVNRLLTPYMLNAIRLLETGTGSIGAIDKAMMLGAGYPMGPFALADYIGLDVVNAMATNIYDDVRQQYTAAPHTLTRLVLLGYLGRKSGLGFYDYSQRPPVPNPALKHPVG